MKVVAVSGGFDPLYIGHIRLFREARQLGDKLVVILNSDQFLLNKKGYVFMEFAERKEMLESIRYVDEVIECIDTDHTVRETLRKLRPHIFANGGDRTEATTPEHEVCLELGIEPVYGVVPQLQSSSRLTKQAAQELYKKGLLY